MIGENDARHGRNVVLWLIGRRDVSNLHDPLDNFAQAHARDPSSFGALLETSPSRSEAADAAANSVILSNDVVACFELVPSRLPIKVPSVRIDRWESAGRSAKNLGKRTEAFPLLVENPIIFSVGL